MRKIRRRGSREGKREREGGSEGVRKGGSEKETEGVRVRRGTKGEREKER